MKRFTKILALLLCVPLLMISALAMPGVEAAELVTLDRQRDIIVSVRYDTQEPGIVLIAPDGRIYTSDDDYAAVERGSYAVNYYIEGAQAGTWRIQVDKRGNSEVDVSVFPWEKAISIDALTVTGLENGYVTGEATFSGYEGSFRYYVYAVPVSPDGTNGGRIDLGNGSGRGGSVLRIRQSVSQLADGEYRLGLEAYYTNESGAEVASFALSDNTFTVTGVTVPGEPGDLTAVLDLTQSTLELSWTAGGNRITGWTVEIVPSATPNEVYYRNEQGEGYLSASILLDPEVGDLDVTVTGKIRNGGYLEYTRHITWDDGVDIAFETPEFTNSLTGTVDFDMKGKTVTAALIINGESQELRLTGAQKLTFQLDGMSVNNVSVEYGAEEGLRYRISRRITVDSVPPTLDIFGVQDRITVSSAKVTLAGSTEPGATLTVNGDEVETDAAGGFKAEIRLSEGENVLVFEAADRAGNKSVRTLIVAYTPSGVVTDTGSGASGGSKIPWVLIGSAAAAVIAAACMAIFGAVTTRRIKKEEKPRAKFLRKLLSVLEGLLCAGTLCSAAAAVLLMLHASRTGESISGANLAAALQQMSASQIAQRAAQVREIRAQALWAGVAAAGCLLAMVLLIALGSVLRKNNAPGQKPAKAEKAAGKPKGAEPVPQPDPAPAPKTEPQNPVCPNCGAPVSSSMAFCANCGAKLK